MKDTVTRVLLIEDNPGDVRLLRELFKETSTGLWHFTHINDINMLPTIDEAAYDVVLMDLNYENINGIESYQYANSYIKQVPIVVLTGLDDEKLAYDIVKMGAQDYIVKDNLDSKMLVRAVRYAIERKKSQTDAELTRIKNETLQQATDLLRQQHIELVALNEAKDDFISLASHQLRTPATSVKQYIGMLKEGFVGKLSHTQQELVNIAYESNERELAIINDLLKIAQVDAGRVKLTKNRTDLVSLLRSSIQDQRSKFQERKQEVELEAQGPIYTEVDSRSLRMAFENIIDNASKYTPESKKITIKVQEHPDKVRAEIKDQGVGIAEKDVVKLFTKFTRILNPLSDTVGGSGLGLYWVKKVVDMHDGTIDVISKLGKGTTFIIDIPRSQKLQLSEEPVRTEVESKT